MEIVEVVIVLEVVIVVLEVIVVVVVVIVEVVLKVVVVVVVSGSCLYSTMMIVRTSTYYNLPVTIFPTVLRAGVWTVVLLLPNNSTRRGATPALSTAK